MQVPRVEVQFVEKHVSMHRGLTYVSSPLSNRFEQRCELVKRSRLANIVQYKKSSGG